MFSFRPERKKRMAREEREKERENVHHLGDDVTRSTVKGPLSVTLQTAAQRQTCF